MRFLAALILLLAGGAYAQDFADYTDYIGLQGPEQFEINAVLKYLPPDYLITFAKGLPLKWELNGVTSFGVREGRLDSILKDRILAFSDGACGGLVLPQNVTGYLARGEFVAAFSDNHIYLYSLSSCAMFQKMHSPSELARYALSSKYVCKGDKTGRFVTRISDGAPVYFDNITQTEEISANSAGCYFLSSNGEIDYFDEYMRRYSETESGLTSVKSSENGFSAFSQGVFIKITFAEGMLSEYTPLYGVYGECANTQDGELICRDSFNADIFIEPADKLMASENEYFVLREGLLRAYGRHPQWQRLLHTSFSPPAGCLHNGDLFFSDYFQNLHRVNALAELAAVSEIPDNCDYKSVKYDNGTFYYGKNSFTFAAPVRGENGRNLYKREANGIISYTTGE